MFIQTQNNFFDVNNHQMFFSPYSVDILVTSRCNLQCPFCFGPDRSVGTMNTEDAFRILKILKQHGTKAVVLSGGEPTLVPELPQIVHEAYRLGFYVVLSTNGCFSKEIIDELAPYLHWISLPLDSTNRSVCRNLRPNCPEHYEIIFNQLTYLRSTYPALKIKLGTVVTTLNQGEVMTLMDIVPKNCLPDLWKFYEILYLIKNRVNIKLLRLSTDEFNKSVQLANDRLSRLRIPTALYKAAEVDGKHLFVEPQGNCHVFRYGAKQELGNIINDSELVLKKTISYIDKYKLENNFRQTYQCS